MNNTRPGLVGNSAAPPRIMPSAEQIATKRLRGAPPPLPTDLLSSASTKRTEKRRRQLLLEAQDALAATSQWTREIFTLPSTDGAEAEGSSDEPLRGRLEEWLSRGKQAIAAQAEAHAAEVQQVRDGAAQLLEDLARLKKAGAAGAEEVNAVRKAREVAFPSVKLMPAPGVNPVKAPQDGTTMSAVAEKAEPTAGLLTL